MFIWLILNAFFFTCLHQVACSLPSLPHNICSWNIFSSLCKHYNLDKVHAIIFLSDQLYIWKTRVFLCCQFSLLVLFLIQTEHMRKPRHSWQDGSLKCLILTAQNKTPWACPQQMPAALATKKPFCHLPGQATCSITLHKNLAKGPKHTLWQFKIQNILKNSSKKQVSLNWWTLQSNKTSNYSSETLNGSWGYWQNTLTSVCAHPALGSIDIGWNFITKAPEGLSLFSTTIHKVHLDGAFPSLTNAMNMR